NFIVELFPGDTYLFNEIGVFKGQTAVSDVTSGSYRVKVQADGAWTLKLSQPLPDPDARELRGTFKGTGAKVLQVQTYSTVQPTVTGKHSGEANFIVQMIGFGDLSGGLYLFNEIGHFSGQTVTDEELPPGGYLLYVQ